MKVYIVEKGDYDEHSLHGIYSDKHAAELWAIFHQKIYEKYVTWIMSSDGHHTPQEAREQYVRDWFFVGEYEVIEDGRFHE